MKWIEIGYQVETHFIHPDSIESVTLRRDIQPSVTIRIKKERGGGVFTVDSQTLELAWKNYAAVRTALCKSQYDLEFFRLSSYGYSRATYFDPSPIEEPGESEVEEKEGAVE